MNKLLAALTCLTLLCPAHASDDASHQIVRLLKIDALSASLVKTALRNHAMKLGALEPELQCMDGIQSGDFTAQAVESVEKAIGEKERAEVLAYLATPSGAILKARFDSKATGNTLPPFPPDKLQALEQFMSTDTGRKLENLMSGGPLPARMAEVAKRTIARCREGAQAPAPAR
jgi:hypothetical protein